MRTAHRSTITMGLLSFNIRLGVTVPSTPPQLFHQCHGTLVERGAGKNKTMEPCGGRIRQDRYCDRCEAKGIGYGDVAKGAILPGTDETVILTDTEMDDARGWTAKTFQIDHFAPSGQIDPLRYKASYFMEAIDGGQRAARLLLDVMTAKSLVAVGRIGFRDSESPAVLWIREGIFMVTTLYWPEDMRPADLTPVPVEAPKPQELKMAGQLLDSMTRDFDPAEYANTYRAAIHALAAAKQAGGDLPGPPPAPKTTSGAPDLTEVLGASIAAMKKAPAAKRAKLASQPVVGEKPARRKAS